MLYIIIGSSAMLNGHCNDPEEYDRISCSAASETQVTFLNYKYYSSLIIIMFMNIYHLLILYIFYVVFL